MFLWFLFKVVCFFFLFFFYYEQRNEEDAIEVMWTKWLNCRMYVEKPNSFQATEFNTKCCGCDPTFPIVQFEWRRRWWQLKGKAYLGSDKTFLKIWLLIFFFLSFFIVYISVGNYFRCCWNLKFFKKGARRRRAAALSLHFFSDSFTKIKISKKNNIN